jgi:hypothetical protein
MKMERKILKRMIDMVEESTADEENGIPGFPSALCQLVSMAAQRTITLSNETNRNQSRFAYGIYII